MNANINECAMRMRDDGVATQAPTERWVELIAKEEVDGKTLGKQPTTATERTKTRGDA